MSGSMSLTVADVEPRIVASEISVESLGLSLSELLTSADFSVVGPISANRGKGASAPIAAMERGLDPLLDPLIGAIVADRYRILGLLGRGGMGAVYKVEHTRIGKLLAMKILTGELSQSADAVRRFKREALTVSKLESPNTVQVFDFGVSLGLTYFVMELVNGESLSRVLRDTGPMPFPRLARIVVQIATSLSEAHRKGIVHRDVKPENIMLMPTGRGDDLAKVLDFGLAKLRDQAGLDGGDPQTAGRGGLDDVTCQGMILGTPNYMAPEQIRGEEVDARTDVYAVGALMYRMITGQPVFTAESPLAILTKHLHEAPIPPAIRAPDRGISPAVSRIILRALRKDPRERHQRIEDLQALLVAELRAQGSSSVDTLLDPERLRAIAVSAEAEERAALATRSEVDAYERKLRRSRHRAALFGVTLAVGATGAAIDLLAPRGPQALVAEIEPNNTARDATALTLGHPMTGTLGKRLDATHGDRDFYSFTVPSRAAGDPSFVRLRASALPNMAMCAMLYRPGFPDPLGTYCVGAPGRDLTIPALGLDEGRHLLAIVQDVGAGGFVHESISDNYTVLVEAVTPDPTVEIEPNDHVASATRVALSKPLKAAVGWARDEDFFCAPATATGQLRWKVRAGLSDGGAMEATLFGGDDSSGSSRIQFEEGSATWQSRSVSADGISARCLRVRLASDGDRPARGIGEPYVVEVERAP